MEYPAEFMLVAAMNPCRCGFYPDRTKCRCTPGDIDRFFGKISRPIMDRIDMCINVPMISYDDIESTDNGKYTEEYMRGRVAAAVRLQEERYKEEGFSLNSGLETGLVKKYCTMTESAEKLIKCAFDRLSMSARSYYRTLKVARTIADIEGSELIREEHMAEAIGYKSR